MSIFKCKMCGGTIEFNPGDTVGMCDSCGTKQTLPTTNDEIITNLHNRANTLRLKCEFDKAEEIYNKILEKNPDDAEAHWGIILCKYGIEYVEDPKTYNRVPTCHRTSFDAILARMRITKRRSQTATALSASCTRRKRRRSTAYKRIFSA